MRPSENVDGDGTAQFKTESAGYADYTDSRPEADRFLTDLLLLRFWICVTLNLRNLRNLRMPSHLAIQSRSAF